MISIKLSTGFTTLLALLFIAFKLAGLITWPWSWVVSPLWILPAFWAVILFFALLIVFLAKDF